MLNSSRHPIGEEGGGILATKKKKKDLKATKTPRQEHRLESRRDTHAAGDEGRPGGGAAAEQGEGGVWPAKKRKKEEVAGAEHPEKRKRKKGTDRKEKKRRREGKPSQPVFGDTAGPSDPKGAADLSGPADGVEVPVAAGPIPGGQVSPEPAAQALPEGAEPPTVSIAVAGSIIDNTQSLQLATALAGQIARAAAIFRVDEVVAFDDGEPGPGRGRRWRGEGGGESGGAFLARVLQYLETPQYLRKALIPMHPDLRYAGVGLAPAAGRAAPREGA